MVVIILKLEEKIPLYKHWRMKMINLIENIKKIKKLLHKKLNKIWIWLIKLNNYKKISKPVAKLNNLKAYKIKLRILELKNKD